MQSISCRLDHHSKTACPSLHTIDNYNSCCCVQVKYKKQVQNAVHTHSSSFGSHKKHSVHAHKWLAGRRSAQRMQSPSDCCKCLPSSKQVCWCNPVLTLRPLQFECKIKCCWHAPVCNTLPASLPAEGTQTAVRAWCGTVHRLSCIRDSQPVACHLRSSRQQAGKKEVCLRCVSASTWQLNRAPVRFRLLGHIRLPDLQGSQLPPSHMCAGTLCAASTWAMEPQASPWHHCSRWPWAWWGPRHPYHRWHQTRCPR